MLRFEMPNSHREIPALSLYPSAHGSRPFSGAPLAWLDSIPSAGRTPRYQQHTEANPSAASPGKFTPPLPENATGSTVSRSPMIETRFGSR